MKKLTPYPMKDLNGQSASIVAVKLMSMHCTVLAARMASRSISVSYLLNNVMFDGS